MLLTVPCYTNSSTDDDDDDDDNGDGRLIENYALQVGDTLAVFRGAVIVSHRTSAITDTCQIYHVDH